MCQRRLRRAAAAGRITPEAAAVTESHLAALQICVRVGELLPMQAALQAGEALDLAAGGRWEAYDAA